MKTHRRPQALQLLKSRRLCPQSFSQERLWFLEQMVDHKGAYHIAGGILLKGCLCIPHLQRAIRAVVKRHEILRTSFLVLGRKRLQEVYAAAPTNLCIVDLCALLDKDEECTAASVARSVCETRFSLEFPGLFRVGCIHLSQTRHVMVFSLHHIISDGWSMGVLTREVCEYYNAYVRGGEAGLEEMELQYGDYAVW